jgi:hypothetical protein
VTTHIRDSVDSMTEEKISQVVDYYRSEFSDLVYYFDSMEELRNLTLAEELVNAHNIRDKSRRRMEQMKRWTIDEWRVIFRDRIGYKIV